MQTMNITTLIVMFMYLIHAVALSLLFSGTSYYCFIGFTPCQQLTNCTALYCTALRNKQCATHHFKFNTHPCFNKMEMLTCNLLYDSQLLVTVQLQLRCLAGITHSFWFFSAYNYNKSTLLIWQHYVQAVYVNATLLDSTNIMRFIRR